MKYILFLIVIFFSSFNFEFQQKWVCHTIICSPGLETCIVTVVKANTLKEAEEKFAWYIRKKEKDIGGREKSKSTYAVSTLKDAIMIEP